MSDYGSAGFMIDIDQVFSFREEEHYLLKPLDKPC
jgi:hypothetical protein